MSPSSAHPSSTRSTRSSARDLTAPVDPQHRRELTDELLLRAHQTDDELERQRLHDEVVILNLCVARSLAGRFYHRGIAEDDLDQVAYLALVKSVRGYDPTRGDHLLVYAVPTITGEIKRHFRDCGWAIRPPRRLTEITGRVSVAAEELRAELGREPRPSEIARHTGLDEHDVSEALSTQGCFQLDSTDLPLDPDGTGTATMHDVIGDVDESYVLAESLLDLQRALHVLTPRERRVLELRYYHEKRQVDIGRELGVSQVQISRMLRRITRKLYEEMTKDSEFESA